MSDSLGGGLMKRARTVWLSDKSARKANNCLAAIVDSDMIVKQCGQRQEQTNRHATSALSAF